jgi:hypothetical protein
MDGVDAHPSLTVSSIWSASIERANPAMREWCDYFSHDVKDCPLSTATDGETSRDLDRKGPCRVDWTTIRDISSVWEAAPVAIA